MGFLGKTIECADQLFETLKSQTSNPLSPNSSTLILDGKAPARPGRYLLHDPGSRNRTVHG
jgi:hypothetical protein